MNLPPMVLDLKVASSARRPVRLWLPLFLLWPLALAIGLVALAVAIVVDAVLLLAGRGQRGAANHGRTGPTERQNEINKATRRGIQSGKPGR